MIVQNISADGGHTDITFTVPNNDLPRAVEVVESARGDIEFTDLESATDLSKISIVGVGMRSHAGVAQKMFTVLAEKGINIQVISTSEIKVSVLVGADYTELGVRALHAAFDLDKEARGTAE
jgi:aspartate kinase